ncbi:arsenate reductase [Brevundimonas sp. Leaf363]|uniref:arsenate reductase family protein n=1 Tax=Brevundimonas sp. Leaf363 TaxID=1736353 RepID=UPI0006F69954|nr:arsenate reductase family protein [Brevundimonas sp. Leaf363]KQS55733.1 arsenate reductase [Brevundimonas sp. Leaf363]
MTVTIWHNPRCGTSRNTLAMIEAAGVAPVVIEYLTSGWDAETLTRLADATGEGLRGLLRAKEPEAAGLADAGDDVLLAAMLAEPILVNRPIVETSKGARLCRPSERVLDLLDRPPPRFVKEDGEVVER